MPIILTLVTAVFFFIGNILSASGADHIVTVTLKYNQSDLTISQKDGYDVVSLKNASFPEDEPGTPWLPAVYANILVPAGSVVKNVETIAKDEVLVATGLTLYPTQSAYPLEEGMKPEFIKPKAEAYGKNAKKNLSTSGKPQTARGITVVPVRINPVRLIPATGELYFAGEVEVKVTVTKPAHRPTVKGGKNFETFSSSIKKSVVNPDEPESLPLSGTIGGTDDSSTSSSATTTENTFTGEILAAVSSPCDYLIITKESMRSAFQPLADHRTAYKGLSSQIVSTESIYTSYTGRDNQEKIRNCIKDYVANQGTLYVVLGGDDLVVPARTMTLRAADIMSNVTNIMSATVPVDLYYAGLDGTWDTDRDAKYGELVTTAGDEADLLADVWLGRIPIRTAAHASGYVNKLISHELSPPPGISRKYITGGKMLWNSYTLTNRPSDSMNDGQPQFQASNHPTVSDSEAWLRRAFRDAVQVHNWLPSELGVFTDTSTSWDSTTSGDYSANAANMVTRLNEGWNFAAWLTHGFGTSMKADGDDFTLSHASSLTGITSIFYTGSCHTGAFRTEPCISEAMLRNPVGGAIVYIGSSHWNFGIDDPAPAENDSTCGTAMEFIRKFTDIVFRDQVTNTAQAFYDHKAAFIAESLSETTYRWETCAINYQGDPAYTIIGSELFVNPPPSARKDTYSTPQNTTLTVSTAAGVLANDFDMNGDLLTPTLISIPAHGALGLSSDGSFTYYPVAGFAGQDVFTYKINDGTSDSNEATVTINVIPTVKPIVKITASDSSATETGDKGTFQISLTGGAIANAVTVDFTLSGTATSADYSPISKTVTIPAGSTSVLVNVNPINDTAIEGQETVIATLSTSVFYTIYSSGKATLYIHDDEKPTVSLSITDSILSEPTDKGQIKVTILPARNSPLTINYTMSGTAISGTDYSTPSGSVVIPAGATSALIDITPTDDSLVEGNETVILKVSTSTGYYGVPSTTLTLKDND
jgi:hypothetical protein